MPNGVPITSGTLGPAKLPASLPQNLGGITPYLAASIDMLTTAVTLDAENISGYTSVTIYRVVGTTRTAVRTAVDVHPNLVSGQTFLDYEAPLGVNFYYVLNGDGQDIAQTDNLFILYDVDTYWIKSPGNPDLNTLVEVQSMGAVTRPARILVTTNVLGRKNPHTVTDIRGGRTGSMTITTANLTEQAQLVNLFAAGDTLFFQCPPTYGFPDMYFVAQDIAETWEGVAGETIHSWAFNFVEQDAPASADEATALNDYLRLSAFGTYQNLLNKRLNYLDALQHPWTQSDGTG